MAQPMQQLKQRTDEERRRLAAGEKPKSRFSSRLQRTAARALAGFFAVMLLLTLLSRAAVGLATAKVTGDTPKTGVLTQRFETSGTIEAQGDLTLTLPGGVGVERIAAEKGQRVKAGDALLELDGAGVERTLKGLLDDLRILNLKISNAAQGNTSEDTDAILTAQHTLENAQEDYDRLLSGQDLKSGRAQEDIAQAQEKYNEAVLEMGEAQIKARQALVKAAEEKVKAAEKNLSDVKEAAESAIDGAEQQRDSAQEASDAADRQLDSAQKSYEYAKNRLAEAKAKYDALVAAGSDDQEELARLQDEIRMAQSDLESAEAKLDGMGGSYSSGNSIRKAKENLAKVKERQAKRVAEAEASLKEAQDALTEAKETEDLSDEALVVSAQSAIDSAETALKTAQRSAEDGQVSNEDALFAAKRAMETAQQGVETAEKQAAKARSADEKTRRQAEIERLGYQSEKRTLQEKIDLMQSVAKAGGKLTAPVDGTVEFILEDAGKTQEGVKVAVLSRSDKGFLFKAKIDQTDAEQLALGDEAEISYTQEGKSRSVRGPVSSVGAADDKGRVTVTVALPEGTYPPGVAAKLEIAKRSQQYQSVLPVGALRSDTDGDFVLVVRERQSVLGVEQTVERVDIEVLERDSTQAAVEAMGLLYDDRVVSSASKPIAEGDRVRLETGDDE